MCIEHFCLRAETHGLYIISVFPRGIEPLGRVARLYAGECGLSLSATLPTTQALPIIHMVYGISRGFLCLCNFLNKSMLFLFQIPKNENPSAFVNKCGWFVCARSASSPGPPYLFLRMSWHLDALPIDTSAPNRR